MLSGDINTQSFVTSRCLCNTKFSLSSFFLRYIFSGESYFGRSCVGLSVRDSTGFSVCSIRWKILSWAQSVCHLMISNNVFRRTEGRIFFLQPLLTKITIKGMLEYFFLKYFTVPYIPKYIFYTQSGKTKPEKWTYTFWIQCKDITPKRHE